MKAKFLLPVIFILTALFLSSCQKCDHDEVVPKTITEDVRLIAEYDHSPYPGQPAGGTSQYYNVYISSNVSLGYSVVTIYYSAAAVVPNPTYKDYFETFNVGIFEGKQFVDRILIGSITKVVINGKAVPFNQKN